MDKQLKTLVINNEQINIDKDYAMRYLRLRNKPDEHTQEIIDSCFDEIDRHVSYKASYRYFDISIENDTVCFDDVMKLESRSLCERLRGCTGAIVFVATTSSGLDRLINKYSNVQLARCLIIDSLGSAMIESFCDAFCRYMERINNINLTERFSPGYGDLDIESQKEVLKVCDSARKIGVTLTSGCMMIPKKSVSAIVGVRDNNDFCDKKSACELCDKSDCEYRI